MICQFCKNNYKSNLTLHQKFCKRVHEKEKEIIDFYSKNLSLNKTSKEFGFSVRFLKNTLFKKNNLLKKSRRKYDVNDNFLDNLDKHSAWFLGYMAADGHVFSNSKSGFSISQSGEEGRLTIEYLKKLLNFDGPIRAYDTYAQKSYNINISSKKLKYKLSTFNIVEKKSLIYKYPLNLPEELFLPFLRGYFEGDGCLSIPKPRRGSVYIGIAAQILGTKDFLEEIGKRIPFKFQIFQERGKKIWQMNILCSQVVDFLKWIYSDKDIYKTGKCKRFYKFLEEIYMPLQAQYEKLEKDRKEAAFLYYKEGWTLRDIAKKLGVKRKCVEYWNQIGYLQKYYPEEAKEIEQNKINEKILAAKLFYEDKKLYGQIAKIIGRNDETVRQWIKKGTLKKYYVR